MIVNFGKAINLIWEGERGQKRMGNLGPKIFMIGWRTNWRAGDARRRGLANDGKPTPL